MQNFFFNHYFLILKQKNMKKLSIIFTALFAVSLLLVSWNKATKVEASVAIGPLGCTVLDGDGNGYGGTGWGVATSSGNVNFRCTGSGAPNSTGKAVHWDYDNTGLLCSTTVGWTDNWKEVVDSDGDVNLQCRIRD